MSVKWAAIGGCVLACGMAVASTVWRFDEGAAGAVAETVAPVGRGGYFEKGEAPVFVADVPFAQVWDGGTYAPLVPNNRLSLRFASGATGAGVPFGGEVVVSGDEALTRPASFTLEAFVKIARLTGRHALIASKRRNGQSGASWSLSVTPNGSLGARFDTQPGKANGGDGFNQCVGSAGSLADGLWHHVALTYDAAMREICLYLDYRLCGRGTARFPLVYDAGDFVVGRGLDGGLDEMRLTPSALGPEQFLRPTRFFSEMKPRATAVALLDQTETRVQSALKPDLTKLGTLIPKRVPEIETPMWSLGCETLDRDLADWDAYRNYLVPLGIRRIRLQGGWNRTERKKGEYDFAWLDHIVDDAIGLGLEVCLETSYNNRLYEPGGATGPGGLLPEGEETLAAWDRWVEAMVRHYAPKGVHEWMTYNEPNLRKENTPEKIVANNIRTAAVIRRVDPKARIGAFVLAGLNTPAIEKMLTMIREQGKLDLFRWAIYHGYSANPDRLTEGMVKLTGMLQAVAPNVRAWQGEAGCASEPVQYALSGIDWTEYSHAKWNTRRMLGDFGCGIDSSVFTLSDVSYSKDFISRYGLLKTNPDNSVIKVKTAYYAVQNVVTLFNGALEQWPGDAPTVLGGGKPLTSFAFRDRKSGLSVVALWDGSEIPGNGSDLGSARVTLKGGRFKEPVWVDLITGGVYAIPADRLSEADGAAVLNDVPFYDGPAAVLDRSLVAFEPVKVSQTHAKKAGKKAPKAAAEAAADAVPMTRHLLPGTQPPAPAVLIVGPWARAQAESAAAWLNDQAVHAFVLDAAAARRDQVGAALRAVRGHASEWQVKSDAIGVWVAPQGDEDAALDAGADFVVRTGGAVSPGKQESGGRVFAGPAEGWQAPLAAWLEKRKGKLF